MLVLGMFITVVMPLTFIALSIPYQNMNHRWTER